jgi:hypothetical protein
MRSPSLEDLPSSVTTVQDHEKGEFRLVRLMRGQGAIRAGTNGRS